MKALDYLPDTQTGHRPRDKQPEPTGAFANEDPLADHHIKEVLAALNAITGRRESHSPPS